jgi:hypothetical protein
MLEQYARRLYAASGKINLYISLCCKKSKPNMKKLKSELQMIKDLVAKIEIEADNI